VELVELAELVDRAAAGTDTDKTWVLVEDAAAFDGGICGSVASLSGAAGGWDEGVYDAGSVRGILGVETAIVMPIISVTVMFSTIDTIGVSQEVKLTGLMTTIFGGVVVVEAAAGGGAVGMLVWVAGQTVVYIMTSFVRTISVVRLAGQMWTGDAQLVTV
jgi:hypothetical protein